MRRISLIGLLAGLMLCLIAAPAAAKGGFAAHAGDGGATITSTSGVYFTITGGGNRTHLSVEVNCADSSNTVIYGTVINVVLDADGNGTSQTIYPPVSNCTALEEKPMQIGRPHILATITFTVA